MTLNTPIPYFQISYLFIHGERADSVKNLANRGVRCLAQQYIGTYLLNVRMQLFSIMFYFIDLQLNGTECV